MSKAVAKEKERKEQKEKKCPALKEYIHGVFTKFTDPHLGMFKPSHRSRIHQRFMKCVIFIDLFG